MNGTKPTNNATNIEARHITRRTSALAHWIGDVETMFGKM